MCMFTQVTSIEHTSIFARRSSATHQCLVYEMTYQSGIGRKRRMPDTPDHDAMDMAMILPLPTPPRSAEDGVRFVSLAGYDAFFDDMSKGFPAKPHVSDPFELATLRLSIGGDPLVVHDVGSYEASFVPTEHDFARLDERFRLPAGLWRQLPEYADYGFAVFKLKSTAHRVHPMAFEFPIRSSMGLFFPTVHVHDGQVHPEASFNHSLYCQAARAVDDWTTSFRLPPLSTSPVPDLGWWLRVAKEMPAFDCFEDTPEAREIFAGVRGDQARLDEWYRSASVDTANLLCANEFMLIDRSEDLVVPNLPIQSHPISGARPNRDTLVPAH